MKRYRFLPVLLAALILLTCAAPALAAEATTPVSLGAPSGLLLLEDGALLVTDVRNNNIVTLAGGVTAVYAGRTATADVAGRPTDGYYDGEILRALFAEPWAIAPYLDGYAVTDTANHVVRYLVEDKVYTIVGTGEAGFHNDTGVKAAFHSPKGLAADDSGNLYVADCLNNVIRKIDQTGHVTTYAGSVEGCADGALSSAMFCEPTGLCWYEGALYVCDSGNQRIRVIQNGTVTTLAGSDAPYYEDSTVFAGDYVEGAVSRALFSNPTGVAVRDDAVYVADTGNAAIRKIQNGQVTTLLRQNTGSTQVYPTAPRGLAVAGELLYVADPFAGLVYTISLEEKETPVFSDIATDAVYAGAVGFVAERGLFNGVSATEFAPDATMTRAMFVTVLSRLCENTRPNEMIAGEGSFEDVPAGQWYSDAVAWGASNGLVMGIDGTRFGTDNLVTRQQAAVFLYRYAQTYSPAAPGESSDYDALTDRDAVAGWAAEAVGWALSLGIFRAGEDGALNPAQPLTRAEVAVAFEAFFTVVTK